MTREEAIRVLKDNRPSVIFEDEDAQKRMAELCQAIDMAIEALNIVMDSENDVIKRQDAIKTVCRTRCRDKAKGCPAHSCPVIEEFDALPSAEAVQEWIPVSDIRKLQDILLIKIDSFKGTRNIVEKGMLEVWKEVAEYIDGMLKGGGDE